MKTDEAAPGLRARLTIIWGAHAALVVAYTVIGAIIGRGVPTANVPLLGGLVLVALSWTAFVLLGAPFVAGFSRKFLVYCVVRWSIAESVVLFGLLYHFLTHQAPILYGAAGWSLLLLLLTGPWESEQRRYDDFRTRHAKR